ncbi:MAG TPA: DUF58 domain-containing protein [Vicinamibacterales bacterium]|nr:DUF58 domain-containing protein [Vicinamibacterales bacterium]
MLDAALLSSIRDLEFVARVTVDGALAGLHRSPFHGYSAEFSQYRHYRPGDDLKYVDWKLFARTDRVYTKQFRETTNLRMQLVLDASASMAFGEPRVSKMEYARQLAAALAHLVVSQGDAAGLTVYDAALRTYVGPRPGRSHLRHLLTALSRVDAAGRTRSAQAIRAAVDLLENRGAVVCLSDLYDDEGAVDAELHRAARIGHDVTVFHVLAPEDLEWRWGGDVEVEDSETGQRVLTSAAAAGAYAGRAAAFVQQWRERCLAYGADYVLARTDQPPAQTLRAFLLQRQDVSR